MCSRQPRQGPETVAIPAPARSAYAIEVALTRSDRVLQRSKKPLRKNYGPPRRLRAVGELLPWSRRPSWTNSGPDSSCPGQGIDRRCPVCARHPFGQGSGDATARVGVAVVDRVGTVLRVAFPSRKRRARGRVGARMARLTSGCILLRDLPRCCTRSRTSHRARCCSVSETTGSRRAARANCKPPARGSTAATVGRFRARSPRGS